VTFHDLRVPYLFPKAGPLRRWVVDELARRCDLAITTNREDYESLRRRIAAAPALIPIGSNIAPRLPEDFDRHTWRARLGVRPDDLLLCFFGFVNDRKGVDTLLHALHTLATERTQTGEVHLLMIGGQTGSSDPTNVAYLAEIERLICELGVEDHVQWTGFVPSEEVSASFSASDVCVLPFRDGVSFLHGTLHAALAHGVPIITTQPRVSLPELVDGENILLVPPDAPEALADAIRRLAASSELRPTLATGALELSGQFLWSKIAADTRELYLSVGVGA
jgi:glycosyltransferase involved in cell wall biosynthesis